MTFRDFSQKLQQWDQHTDALVFSLFTQTIFAILNSIIETDRKTGKQSNFHQADFYERLIYLQCLHYRTTDYLQKKFLEGSSVIEIKQLLENLIYNGKNRFFVHKSGRPQDQKNTPSSKTNHTYLQNCPRPPPLSCGRHKLMAPKWFALQTWMAFQRYGILVVNGLKKHGWRVTDFIKLSSGYINAIYPHVMF